MRKYAFDAIISRSAPDLRESGYKSRGAGARQEQGSTGARLVTRQPQTSEQRDREDRRYWPLLIPRKLESQDGTFVKFHNFG